MRPRSCNALTVFRVADRDRVNFAIFESAQQHIAAQRVGLKLIAVLQVREQPVRFRSSRKAPQSTLVLCQVVTVCALLAIESGSSANRKLSRNGLGGDQWRSPRSRLPARNNCRQGRPLLITPVEWGNPPSRRGTSFPADSGTLLTRSTALT